MHFLCSFCWYFHKIVWCFYFNVFSNCCVFRSLPVYCTFPGYYFGRNLPASPFIPPSPSISNSRVFSLIWSYLGVALSACKRQDNFCFTWVPLFFRNSNFYVVGWEVTWFHYAVHFLEYLANEKCLRDEVFCLLMISPFIFLQRKICWNYDNTLHIQIRIWHVRELTWQKFINITLVVLKILIMFKSTWFSRTFDTKQAWCK